MTKINYRKICIQSLVAAILVVTVLVLQFGCLGVINAYAATSTVKPTKSDYYLDYSSGSLDTTGYYREAGVTNNVVEYGLGNGVFEWSSGASVMKDDLNTLVFQLNLKDPQWENVTGHGKNTTYLSMYFTLYSCSRDGSNASPLLTVLYGSTSENKGTTGRDVYYLARTQYGIEQIGLVDCFNGVDGTNGGVTYSELDGAQLLGGSYVTKLMRWSGTDEKHVNLAVKTSSAYTRYFVRACAILYSEKEYILGSATSTSNYYQDVCSCIDTSVVSVADVLGNMKAKDGFDSLSTSKQAEAEHILTDGAYETVQVWYLDRIGNTPFAQAKTAYVEVPVINQVIKPADVATSLGVSTLAVMQSYCEGFEYDEADNIYRAKYLKSVWLSAKAADGHNTNYFLDCNLSYKDYYRKMVDDEIFDDDVYEWMLNRIYEKFPETLEVTADNLYGYFGYVVIPKSATFSEMLFEMFDGGQSHFEGTVDQFYKESLLAWESYNKLLTEYEYTWLEKGWNAVAGFVQGSKYEAYNYFFYVDSGITESFIANNGATSIYDNMSHFGTSTKEAIDDIADALSDLWMQYQEILMIVLGGGALFVFFFTFFYLSTKIFRLKAAVNKYKASKKEKERVYALAQRQETATKRNRKSGKHKYRRG